MAGGRLSVRVGRHSLGWCSQWPSWARRAWRRRLRRCTPSAAACPSSIWLFGRRILRWQASLYCPASPPMPFNVKGHFDLMHGRSASVWAYFISHPHSAILRCNVLSSVVCSNFGGAHNQDTILMLIIIWHAVPADLDPVLPREPFHVLPCLYTRSTRVRWTKILCRCLFTSSYIHDLNNSRFASYPLFNEGFQASRLSFRLMGCCLPHQQTWCFANI
jgi:hypothetical protein